MSPFTHAVVGYLLGGPAGAFISLAPDMVLAAGHVASPRHYPDSHPVMRCHATLHTIWPAVGLYTSGNHLLAGLWVIHLLMDIASHVEGERWNPLLPRRLFS